MGMPMDEAPQSRLALGPLEITLRRRGANEIRRVGFPGSIVVHIAVVILWLILAPYSHVEREKEAVLAAQPPVPITFQNPFPPQPPPERRKSPPPPAAMPKELRMQQVGTALGRQVDADAMRRRPVGRQQLSPQRFERARVPRGENHVIAVSSEQMRERATDTGRGSGNQDGLS